jgi:hypothetical protein
MWPTTASAPPRGWLRSFRDKPAMKARKAIARLTLARNRPGVAETSLDTVIVMFLVSYLYFVGNAFLISYPAAWRL